MPTVERQMTPEQIAEALRMARKFKLRPASAPDTDMLHASRVRRGREVVSPSRRPGVCGRVVQPWRLLRQGQRHAARQTAAGERWFWLAGEVCLEL
jgi:hypothetical protein